MTARASREPRDVSCGCDDDLVLEEEPLGAMDERRRVGRDAVVRAAPGREVELALLSRDAVGAEVLDERGDRRRGAAARGRTPTWRTGGPARRRAPRRPRRGGAWPRGRAAARRPPRRVRRLRARRARRAPAGRRPRSRARRRRPCTVIGRSGSGPAVRSRLAATSSGASGAQCCQASTSVAAAAGGQRRSKVVASGSGSVASTKLVTTPNRHAPAPRSAQNRSPWWCSSQRTIRPSASTTSAASSWSEVSPCRRPRIPSPPPRVRPAMPTVGPQPPAIVRPCSASASYSGPSVAPAPTVTAPSATLTAFIGPTSRTRPGLEEPPSKQWPPLRAVTAMSDRRATATASTTSSGVRQRTTAAGRTSQKRAIAGLRDDSYSSDPGRTTSPAMALLSAFHSAADGTVLDQPPPTRFPSTAARRSTSSPTASSPRFDRRRHERPYASTSRPSDTDVTGDPGA